MRRISAMSLVYDQPLSSSALRSLAPIGRSTMQSCSSRKLLYRESVAAAANSSSMNSAAWRSWACWKWA
jgi:hypothetical protein